jgi:hypothetical protein
MKSISNFLSLSVRFALLFAGFTPVFAAEPAAEGKSQPADVAATPKEFKLPGIIINAKERYVDVESTVCLEGGTLELIATTKGGKEHESILILDARPIHIHTALLLVGAKNGNPAIRRPKNKELSEWEDFPPKGDAIEISIVLKNADGAAVERPIGDFITRRGEDDAEKKKEKFPSTFVFAGSILGDPAQKPREYLAETSGNVISISTFGDELLCLSGHQSQENGALLWEIDPTHLPKLNSKVTLRLRAKKPN